MWHITVGTRNILKGSMFCVKKPFVEGGVGGFGFIFLSYFNLHFYNNQWIRVNPEMSNICLSLGRLFWSVFQKKRKKWRKSRMLMFLCYKRLHLAALLWATLGRYCSIFIPSAQSRYWLYETQPVYHAEEKCFHIV